MTRSALFIPNLFFKISLLPFIKVKSQVNKLGKTNARTLVLEFAILAQKLWKIAAQNLWVKSQIN